MVRSIAVISFAGILGLSAFGASEADAQTFAFEKSGGCANIVVYGSNREQTAAIVVRADRELLGLGVGTTALSLANTPKGLEVRINLFAKPLPGVDYCTDIYVPGQDKPTATMRAQSGQVVVTLGERGAVKDAQSFMYQATVVLRDLSFKKSDGSVVFVKGPITLTAVVGYYWG